jgi:hypothetical protein
VPAAPAAPDATAPVIATPDGTAPASPPAPDVAPVPQNVWVPGTRATIGVLDKVDGSTDQISIAVGAAAQKIGDLEISVQSCVNRPPDQIPDTAIFLTVQNPADDAGAPLYRGWMVRSMPGAAVVGDAGETFRVIGCS